MCACAASALRRRFSMTSHESLIRRFPRSQKNPFSFSACTEVTEVDLHSGVRGSRWAFTPAPTESKVTPGWKTANLESLNPLRTQSKGPWIRGGGAAHIFINLLDKFMLSRRCFRKKRALIFPLTPQSLATHQHCIDFYTQFNNRLDRRLKKFTQSNENVLFQEKETNK